MKLTSIFGILIALLIPSMALASSSGANLNLDLGLTASSIGYISVAVFVIAYLFVMTEEITHLNKSKPVIVSAAIIWTVTAVGANMMGMHELMRTNLENAILEYAELFLFLLVAMTYVNTLQERRAFEALKAWLLRMGLSYRGIFWITGILAFIISPIADNLTTALIMCSIVMAVGKDDPKFVCLSCINIVVAANAGGAFSPFGDITTLMVWEKGIVPFQNFFQLFIPALVNFMVPAILMHFALPKEKPKVSAEKITLKVGAKRVILLFICTIITAVCCENFVHIPPVIGMMAGLGYLQLFGYALGRYYNSHPSVAEDKTEFNIFRKIANAEWDTLLFFYGILLSVSGLATLGYLSLASHTVYQDMHSILPGLFDHTTQANVLVGLLSAIIDNIPVMFAILTMHPTMSEGQWLLVTLTAGVGGSLLSIGSAAGVAVMGHSHGRYSFFGHLKWIWAIALGYFLSIAVHIWINAASFHTAIPAGT